MRDRVSDRAANQSHFLQSAFWNPKTHMILTTKSIEKRTNVCTNTASFARNFARSVPKFKVKQGFKKLSDLPQPGYYDTAKAFDKTFGREPVNSVRMDMELARKNNFSGGKTQTATSVDARQLPNKWTNKQPG